MPPEQSASAYNHIPRRLKIVVGIITTAVLLVIYLITPPFFPGTVTISVTRGESISQIATELKHAGLIRSRTLFTILIQVSNNPIVATGDYLFSESQSIFTVVNRFKNAQYGLPKLSVTLREGLTVTDMAKELSVVIPNFDVETFIEKATPFEGYLFPDTYIFNENVTADEVIALLRKNFDTKISEISNDIDTSPYTLEQIVTMASIVEKEATTTSRIEVANILWKRFEINMPLQVDAAFVYEIGKATHDLSRDDLEKDSPYNTYTRTGLTPTPISNPGIESIKAAAQPQPTNYLYFLTGRDGKMYYASTFEGHKQNRALYLD